MLNKLTMKLRLMLVIGPLTLMLAAIGALGLNALADAAAALQTVYADRTVALSQLSEVEQLMARARGDAMRPLTTDDAGVLATAAEKIEHKMDGITESYGTYMKTYMDPEEKALADALNTSVEKYLDDGLKPALVAVKA